MKKKILSILLTLAMIMSLMPTAMATEGATNVTEVATYEALVKALEQDNANVKLLGDITADATQGSGYGKAGIVLEAGDVLDGAGHKLTINGANATWDCAVAMKGGEVKNLTIAGAMRGVFMPGANGDVVIDTCIFEDVIYTFNSDAGSKDYAVTIKDTVLNGWTSFSNVHKSVTFADCEFGEGSGYAYCRPYQGTTFEDCTFAKGYELDTKSVKDGNALVFNECTYDGAPLSAENREMFYAGGDVVIDGTVTDVNYYAAKIDDALYDTLAEAIAAAQAGDEIVLLADVTVDSTVVINKAIILNGNGHEISGTASPLLSLSSTANVTVQNAKLTTSGNVIRCGYVNDNYTHTYSNCQISGGVYGIHYDGNSGGNVVIDGCIIDGFNAFAGALELVTVKNTTFDANQSNYAGANFWGNTVIENVTLIDEGKTTWLDTKTVAEVIGGKAVQNGTEVSLESYLFAEAKIGTTYYHTLSAAIAAAEDGDTIEVLSNITIDKSTVAYNDGTYIDGVRYNGDASFTVDFNGYTVTDDGCVNDYLIYLNNKGEKANEITFTNGTLVSKNGYWSTLCVGASSSPQKTVLNLNGMNIINSNGAKYQGNDAVRVRGSESVKTTVNVNNGTVITSDGASYGVSCATSGAIVNINEGATVIQKNSGTSGGNNTYAAVGGKGVMNIDDGAEIISDLYGVHTMTTGTPVVNVYGGTITAQTALKASTNGGEGQLSTINVYGGTINGALETYTENGHIVAYGGRFTSPLQEVVRDEAGNVVETKFDYVAEGKVVVYEGADEYYYVGVHCDYIVDPANGDEKFVDFHASGYVVESEATPERSGYTFKGWKDQNGNTVTFPYTVTESVTITAQWEKKASGGSSGGSSGGGASAPSTPTVKPDTSAPTVSTETTTDTTTGSTTTTETKKDGTTVETTTNKDGSSTTTASKTETTTNKDGSTTTTTATNTKTETATGDKVTEEKVEEKVENKDGSTTTTTTTKTETITATGEKVTVKAEEKVVATEEKTTTTTTTETKSTETGLTVTEKKVEETKVDAATGKEVTTSTTETKSSNGSKSTTTVDETGKVEAEVTVSSTAVKNTAKAEEAVTLPMPAVEATKSTETAPTVNVNLPASAKETKVEIPVADVTPGTVVVAVDAEGNETVIPTTTLTENGVAVTIEGDVTLKVVDNSKDFIDVPETYTLSDSIDFVSARGLFEGTTETTFTPHSETTVAQTMTVLARLSGEDFYGAGSTTKGAAWAEEKGLSDGTPVNEAITREQIVVMMWKLAGMPTSKQVLTASDADQISADALVAMQWAVEMGILKGNLDGTINPNGNASRAHVAAFSERYVNAIAQ